MENEHSLVISIIRSTALIVRVLSRKSTFVAYAAKLAKDLFTAESRLIYRYLSASDDAICCTTLDLLAAMASVDTASTGFLYENFDFGLRNLNSFAGHRRQLVLEPFTQVSTCSRDAFITFITALLTHGHYELKLAVVKMNSLLSPVLDGLFNDAPEQVLSFLEVCDRQILCHAQQHSKTMTAAFLQGSNAASLTKLLTYNNPVVKQRVLDLLNRLTSPKSPFNVIFRVERLAYNEVACIRNRSLQAILGNLNIFQSIDQLQLALLILENCPDLIGPYLKAEKFSFEPEYAVKWLTLCSFLMQVARLRPERGVEIDRVPSCEFLLSAICPLRAALNRAILSDSALIKFYSLQLLVALLEKLAWCVKGVEEEIEACESGAFGMLESARRLEALQSSRTETIESVQKLIPDWQTVQSVLNALISQKELSHDGQLDALLTEKWREDLLIAGLDCARYYIQIFVAEEDSLEQAHFEDPVKYIAPLLQTEPLSKELIAPLLRFCAAFPRFTPADTPAWNQLLCFLCKQKSSDSLAVSLLSSIFYSSGLFLDHEAELEAFVEVLDAEHVPLCLKELLSLSKKSIFVETENSPFIARLEEIDAAFVQKIEKKLSEPLSKRVKLTQVPEVASTLSESSDSESSDSDSSDSDSEEKREKARIQIDLPDPETTAPAVLVSLLLSHVDRARMLRFCSNFPVHRKLLSQPQRRRVNENMLKDLLYGVDDFSVFCNWLALLGGFIGKLPKGSLDVYALTGNSLLGAMVCGLSSEDSAMRRQCAVLLSWTVEESSHAAVQNDKLVQVYASLRQLQRSIDLPVGEKEQPRLSPVLTLFFAQILPILLSPEHSLFATLAALAHDGPFLRLSHMPLFDSLVRGFQLDPENIVDRAKFVKRLCWLLKVAEFGCKEKEDLLEGPLNKSKVLETAMTLFSIFAPDAGKNAEAERAVQAIVKVLVKAASIDAELIENELGLKEWALLAVDALKASTKQHELEETKIALQSLLSN